MEFWVLGSLDVTHRGRSLIGGTPRDRTVLAILLARANETVGVDLLIDELWPEEPPAQARALARGYVSRIRRVLRDSAAGDAAARRLVTRKPGYLLHVESGELDLLRFEKAVDDARRTMRAGNAERCRESLRQIRELWRGTPFTDVPPTATIRATAARLTELRMVTLEGLFDVALNAGQDADIVTELGELGEEHPLRERLVGQLMLALHRCGRTAAALEVYQRVKRRLADELGIDPGVELQRRQLAILRDEPGIRPHVPTVPADPMPGGVSHPPAATPVVPSPPVAHPAPVPHQLPAESALFTGRARELAELDAAGDGAAVTIKVIDGMAGAGKTALAIRAAHRLAHRYPDGQLFLDLHGFTGGVRPVEPADALDRLLRGLGIPGEAVPNHLDDRSALLRTTLARRRVLLLLDNAAGHEQVRALMPGTPGCLVLITSRHRLADLDEADPVSLDVLPPADAVTLFTRIAERHRPGAAPPDLVIEIVESCGRLPLAIRVAAARLRAHPNWSLADLLDRLRDHRSRLAELRAGQRSVGAALDLSYDTLTDHQRRAYRLLGLQFGPEIDVSAAAALLDTTPARAREHLDALLHVHLLSEPTPGRYRLHDLTRAHVVHTCREREREEDRRAALSRLLDHYASTATAAIDALYPQEAPREPFTAPDDGAGEPPSPADAATWLRQGPFAEAHARYEQARVIARHAGDRVGELHALIGLAAIGHERGRRDRAIEQLGQALSIARDTGDRLGEMEALCGLGDIDHMRRRPERAAAHYEQALVIAREVGRHGYAVEALTGLGHALRESGE
ncbi:BTAD domain-containing putative transcriptional regulator [Spirillospora sp. NPDC047279]|uniref:AfsR/SARP family transcriptional regulator n=1 Tax=Spirillospora sp. NPDC047279 TaxID=3155478 RepID=UPI0033F32DA2